MSWIRLDDQIAHHPKFTRCSPAACWMYVTCIGFAQKFLTDGFIPTSSLRMVSHVQRAADCMAELLKVGLMERTDGGYKVHDYLDFNDSAEVVKAKREADRKRKMSDRNPSGIQPESERIPESVLARAPASHPIPSHPSLDPINKLKRKAGVSSTNGNGKNNTKILSALADKLTRRKERKNAPRFR